MAPLKPIQGLWLHRAAWALLTTAALLPLLFRRDSGELGRTLIALGPCFALVPHWVMKRRGPGFSIWHLLGALAALLGIPLL